MIVERARGVAGGVDASSRVVEELTTRELEVLRLLAQGLDNSEIAKQLYLSPTTVKRHISGVFAKVGAANRVEAAIWAVRAGVI
jgi:DNA-binding NarL/FixJ family response regulator